jgi:hypothetical protein
MLVMLISFQVEGVAIVLVVKSGAVDLTAASLEGWHLSCCCGWY